MSDETTVPTREGDGIAARVVADEHPFYANPEDWQTALSRLAVDYLALLAEVERLKALVEGQAGGLEAVELRERVEALEAKEKFSVWRTGSGGWRIAWKAQRVDVFSPGRAESIKFYAAEVGVSESDLLKAVQEYADAD